LSKDEKTRTDQVAAHILNHTQVCASEMCNDKFGACNPQRDRVFATCPPIGPANKDSESLISLNMQLPKWHWDGDWGLLKEKEEIDGEPTLGAHLLNSLAQGSDQDHEAMVIIKGLFPGLWRGLVIELGALDGKKFSVTRRLESVFKWRCILIEGNPKLYPDLLKNRPNSLTINAVVGKDQAVHYVHDANSRRASFATGGIIEYMSPQFLKIFHPHLVGWRTKDEVVRAALLKEHTLPVKSVVMHQLLHMLHVSEVDVLVLDVEGAEMTILQDLDFNSIRFKVISVEVEPRFRAGGVAFGGKITALLHRRGYVRIMAKGRNLWFAHNDFYPEAARPTKEQPMCGLFDGEAKTFGGAGGHQSAHTPLAHRSQSPCSASMCSLSVMPNSICVRGNAAQMPATPNAASGTYALAPTVFLIGGQKCGTTSLSVDVVKYFPELVRCNGQNERHFFDHPSTDLAPDDTSCDSFLKCEGKLRIPNAQFDRNASTWPSNPACAPNSDFVGAQLGLDATPYFPAMRGAPARMHEFYGPFASQLKLLLVLRDPVDRLHSWFKHFQPELVFEDFATKSLRALEQNPSVCKQYDSEQRMQVAPLCEGIYYDQLLYWVHNEAADERTTFDSKVSPT
jgi:FkbM family methyltransferase